MAALAINFVLLSLAVVGGHAVTTPQKLVFTQDPSTCSAGAQATLTGANQWDSTCQPIVQIQDLTGTLIDSQDQITLAITSGTGASGANLVCSSGLSRHASNGTVGFSGCQIDKAASGYTLTATDVTNPSPLTQNGTSGSFSISAGPTTQLGVSGIANPDTSGSVQSVTVTAEDAGGNKAGTQYTGTVHFTSSDSAASLPADYTFLAGDANSKSFSVTLNTHGTQTVTATDTHTGSINGSQTVTVNPGAATHFTVSAPSTATAGSPVSVSVTAFDAAGNTATGYGGTVHFTSTDLAATLPADSTLTNGAGTFPVTFNTAGSQTVTGTDTSDHNITGTSSATTVSAGTGTLSFVAGHSPDTPEVVSNGGFESGGTGWTTSVNGAGLPPTVPSTAKAYSGSNSALIGNTSVEFSGDSVLTSNAFTPSAGSTLSFVYWPASTDTDSDSQQAYIVCGTCTQNQTTVFHVTHSNAQAWIPVQFDLTAFAGKSINLVFDVTEAGGATPSYMYVDDVQVSGQLAGAAFAVQPEVHAQDNTVSHNPIAGLPVTIGLLAGTGTPGAAVSCTNNTVTTDSSGDATFSGCKVDTTGYFYELQATTSTAGDAAGTSLPFSAPGTILWFHQSPNNSTGGVAFSQQPTVYSVTGAGSGTADTSDSSTSVTLALTPGTGSGSAGLTCSSNPTSVSAGVAAFSGCSVDKASATPYTLTATGSAAGVHAYPATSAPFTISAGPTAKFGLSGLAGTSTAGDTQTLTVTPEDAGGNAPATAYAGPVYISFSTGTNGGPSGSATPASMAAGNCGISCSFGIQLTNAGTDTVTAGNATSSPTVTGADTTTVNPAPTSTFQVTAPNSATSGSSFNVTVTALDAFGNQTGSAYTGTVHFTTSDGAGGVSKPADSTLTGGTGTFPFTLITAGTQTVTATDAGDGTITGTSGSIDVTPGSAHSLTIAPKNAAITAGNSQSYSATAFDSSNNSLGDVTSQATFSISPDGACTGGTGANGGAPGNNVCGSTVSGPHTVTATYSTATPDTANLTVNPGPVSSITISPQNAVTSPGSPVAYTTTGYDTYGNSSGDVTALTAFAISPSGSCTRADGVSTTAPGNNHCGAGSYGTYTVTGTYSPGITAHTQLTEDPGWAKLPGSARDLGAWNGNLSVIGTNPTGGGYGIYRWNGGGFTAYPGGAVRIGVGPSGNPVVVNSSNSIFRWTGSGWQQLPGAATDVAVGGSGSDSIYVIGTNATGDGFGIWHYVNGGWVSLPGGGVRIAVGPDGNPTIVNAGGGIWHWNGSAWNQLPGAARDIGVGANGAIWVIGVNAVPSGYGIYQWTGGGFSVVPGGGTQITVGSNGLPIVVNDTFDIYQRL